MNRPDFRPSAIEVRGARVHNLKAVDVDIPLNAMVGICGVSGSGKSSLALGVLYAEGSRRYLESLSTYTRRRLTQAARAQVDEVRYVPAALALHQRPGVPGMRSTFGTASELLNSLRLMFSRLASHRCPKGHMVPPSLKVAREQEIVCPECGTAFYGPGAEELAFNSQGACPRCQGTGVVRVVDEASLVPDESLSIDEGAVLPWQRLMWSLMKDIARDLGVRTDVPFRELSPEERELVFHGAPVKRHMVYQMKTGESGEMDFTYFSAVHTVENALAKVKDEQGMKRVEPFLRQSVCPECGGTRLSERARAPKIRGISLADACSLPLADLAAWVGGVPDSLPEALRPMARGIVEAFERNARRLMDLGLGYLALDRASSTLSTGERQRVQLARAVRNRTTGVLYVLDEPTVGLHPANVEGVAAVMDDLLADGNSVLLVDHDAGILSRAGWLVEMGPGAGARGGRIVCQGTVEELCANPASAIGACLAGGHVVCVRPDLAGEDLFAHGALRLRTGPVHTVRALETAFPKGRLSVVTGVSGSGKTTLVLECLVPALEALFAGRPLPQPVEACEAPGLARVRLIDADPIGANVRSTVATYAGVHDELRKVFARTPDAKGLGFKAGDFSYNTGKLRCPECDGTGTVSLDVQFLPDVAIPCPACQGSRYARQAGLVRRSPKGGGPARSLPELMAMSVDEALAALADMPAAARRLATLSGLGLGYLALGEDTPSLSGGEAQRLKLAAEMGRRQQDAVYVFDEPTVGLHPLDVETLLGVFRSLTAAGATVVVVEHDLDVVRSADYVVDMGPGGGLEGGRIVYQGTPEGLCACPESQTGRYLERWVAARPAPSAPAPQSPQGRKGA